MHPTNRSLSSRICVLAGRLAFFCLLLFHSPAPAAATGFTLVQHKGKDAGTNTTGSVAFQNPNTAGNFIAVAIRGGLSSSQVFTVKDSNGNTYNKAVQIGFTASAVTSAIYYAENIKGGANTVTVSMTVNAPLRFAILEYSGVATSNSLDTTAAATATGTAVSSGNATTTVNGDLELGSVSTVNGATFTAGTGYVIRDSVPNGSGTKLITEDRIQAAAGISSATATLAASDTWGALMAAFKPAGGVSVVPSITSLSPTSGQVGTSVTITGTNFGASQGTSTVTFDGTAATPTSWSATSIVVPVPTGATNGNVIVTVGPWVSNAVAFTVLVPPSITSLSPTFAPLGASVTITGTNFGASQGTSSVTFNGTTATPTSWSATSIVVPVPSGATTGNVVVTVSGLTSNGVPFNVAPSITSLSPASGPVGTSVTVTGTSFGATQGASAVTFGASTATPTTWNNTTIVAQVPAGATTGNVIVMVNGIGSNRVLFAVTPSITSLSPTSGPVGTSVTITGTSFGASQGTSTVTFNGTAATPTSWSATSIVVPVPSGATTGNVVVTVNGLSSNGAPFTVNPISVSVSPAAVTLGTGAQQIFSSTLQNDSLGNGVTWALSGAGCSGSACGTIQPNNAAPGEIYNAPASAPNPSGVTLTATSVTDPTKSASATITVVQATAPNIGNLNPSSGPLGSSITITGTNFGNTQGSSVLLFNSTQVVPTSWSNTSIVATVPASLSGNANTLVQVVVFGLASNQANFSITPPPNITSLSPNSGPASSRVVITGANFGAFVSSDTVSFNGTLTSSYSWSDTSIGVIVPSGGTSGNVVVTVSGVASNGVSFTYGPDITPPTTPASLTATAATGLLIDLAWTASTDNVGVANYLLEECQGVGCTNFTQNPPLPGNMVPFFVVGPVAPSTSYSFRLRAVDAAGNLSAYSNVATVTTPFGPSIASLSPTSGPVGTSVTISGINFGDTQGTSTINFNGTIATPTSWGATSIATTVPSGATQGNVVVTVNGVASNASWFSVIYPTPTITSMSPTQGAVGTSVTITGTNFGASQGTGYVTFNFTHATPTNWSPTSITVPVPPGASTGNVSVTANGILSNYLPFAVTPTITNVYPPFGAVGDSVSIPGTNFGAFAPGDTVTFNGTPATIQTWLDSGATVLVPVGATTGPVVVTAGGFASNSFNFTVTPVTITSLNPASGPVGTSVTIRGTNFGATQGSSAIAFAGTGATTPTSWSQTAIVALVPPGAITGNVTVMVGGVTSNAVTFTVGPPPPSIMSVSPSSAIVGGGPLTVTVTGTNFASSSTVQWNGSPLSTTFLSSTQLQATVTSTNIASIGAAKITVSNATAGGAVSNVSTFFVGQTGGSNFATIVVNQAAQDIVYDPQNQVFYLSVPGTATTNPNTVAILDPAVAAITSTQPTGSNPDVLAISDDSQFLYAGIDGTSTVQRFVLPGLAPDISYSLGTSPYYGPNIALDLQVATGAPHTTAVSIGNTGVSPAAQGGITIFDDATPRPTSAPGFTRSSNLFSSIQWGADGTMLFAANSESSGYDFYNLSVNSTGVTLNQDLPGMFSSFRNAIHFDPGTNLVYSDDGHTINPVNGLPVGNFNANGVMAVDAGLNTAFFASLNSNSIATIESFDLAHFTLINTVTIPGVTGAPWHLIRWGQNGLAFISKAANGTSQVVLLGGDFVSAAPPFVVTPPPAPVVPPVPAPNAPTISSLNPSSSFWPNQRFTLNVTGTQFDPAATVLFNGNALSTTYVSSTQLQAVVPPGTAGSSGTASVVVANPPATGGNSASATFFVGISSSTSSTGTGLAFQIVNQPSKQIAFDSASQRLYLSVPNSATTGNTIAVLDPATMTIIGQQYAGSNPSMLSISDSGQFLYAGLDGSSSVQCFVLPGVAPDISYPLGSNQYSGPYFALDLQVAPGAPHTTAVALGVNGTTTPAEGGVVIFDDATPRATKAPGSPQLFSSIQWGSDVTALFAANNESSGYDFYTLSVTSSGVSLASDFPNTFSSFSNKIHFDPGTKLVYSDDGHVVDPATGKAVGTFSLTGLRSPVMVPDSSLNLAFFATQTGSNSIQIYSYNLTTFAPVSSILFSGVSSGNPIRLIRWGQNGLAFNTDAGQIFLVGGNFVR